MKRAKKAEVTVQTVEQKIRSVVCPHCHTTLKGIGGGDYTKRISCWECNNPIDLIQPE